MVEREIIMDFIGDYRLSTMLMPTEEGFEEVDINEILNIRVSEEEKESLSQLLVILLNINEDGFAYFKSPVLESFSEAEIKELEENDCVIKDGYVYGDKMPWEIKDDGELYFKSEMDEGNPWSRVSDVDGSIVFFTSRYVKI